MSKHEAQLSVCRGAAVGVQSLQSRYMTRKISNALGVGKHLAY